MLLVPSSQITRRRRDVNTQPIILNVTPIMDNSSSSKYANAAISAVIVAAITTSLVGYVTFINIAHDLSAHMATGHPHPIPQDSSFRFQIKRRMTIRADSVSVGARSATKQRAAVTACHLAVSSNVNHAKTKWTDGLPGRQSTKSSQTIFNIFFFDQQPADLHFQPATAHRRNPASESDLGRGTQPCPDGPACHQAAAI